MEAYGDKYSSFLVAIQGWVGPDNADQDFMYSDCWYEVKSAGASATNVTISSLEQLCCFDQGELVVMRIDKVAPDRTGAISLNDIVKRITEILSADTEARDLFRNKLTNYGYLDIQEYAEQKYSHSGTQRYQVDSNFPRLTTKSVPTQIIAVRYDLNLPSLASWQKR